MLKRLLLALATVAFLSVGLRGEAGAVIIKDSAGNQISGTTVPGFQPGVVVVNFKEVPGLGDLRVAPAGAAYVRTGWASVDALNNKYNVFKIEKLFPGEVPPQAGSLYRDLSRYYILEFPLETNLDGVVADYLKDPRVVTAEKSPIVTLDLSTPNDPIYLSGNQWALNSGPDHDLDMPEAWDYERGDPAVILGIVDTGILRSHTDLGGTLANNYTDGNVWANEPENTGVAGVDDDGNGYIDDFWGWDFVTGGGMWPGEEGGFADNDPKDFNGHGTHVSGIAAGMTNSGYGIAGVAGGWYTGQRGCKVMALRIGYSANVGGVERGLVQSEKVGPAVNYARNKGVTALNFSFQIANLQSTKDAVYNALLDGIIIAHSAGNDNADSLSVIDTMTVVGTTNRVISVASTDRFGERSAFSNYGTWVTVSAPGDEVWSSFSNHYTQTFLELSGTSMSAPHVVGLAGLMKSNFPAATGEQIRNWIISTAENIDALNPLYAGQLGSGLINANNFFANVPVAKFSASLTRGHVPFAVDFVDSSSGPVDSLLWEFGDGDISTDTNPTHLYDSAGFYTVRQQVWSDSFGALYGLASVERKDNLIFVIGDSVYLGQGHGASGEKKIPVPIFYQNLYSVTDLKIPIKFTGIASLACDSVSFKGSRIASFLIRSATIDSSNKTILIEGSNLSSLAPGKGLLATAYFTLGSSVAVGDTAAIDTAIVGSATLGVISTDPQAGTYDPKFITGFLAVEPWPRGDVNKSGMLDLADVMAVANYIFKHTAAPDPYWLGDFSADGSIELVDVIMMVNRIFKGI